MSRHNLYWLLGITAISLFSLALVFSNAHTQEFQRAQSVVGKVEDKEDYEDLSLVVDVLQQVRQKYVVELTREKKRKLVEDMINGGLERLDPHSTYINARDLKQFNRQNTGKFGGIGIQVGYDRQNRGQLTVISPMVGTPAYDAGILAGDAIVKIDGKSTSNMRLSEAVEMIQGDPGQKIVLTVLHESKSDPVDITIVRDTIRVQNVLGDLRKADNPKEWDFFLDHETKIGYIRLNSFNETATAEVRAAVEQLQHDGCRGLILDLRNNPGGLLRAAVDISNLFLTNGRIVSTKGRNHKDETFDAKPDGAVMIPAETYPMAVLVNRYSASASEIVAAALQDNNRAIVVGERSYGKGSVQNIIPMEKETSALKLTTASYWRPNGKNIHRFPDSKDEDDWGVRPSEGFEVPMKDEERLDYLLWRNDRDIVRNKPKPADADKGKKEPFQDRVLDKAKAYLKEQLARKDVNP
jgi:carboxyl-terminal processing protease